MNVPEEACDVTKPVLELLRGIDSAFAREHDEATTPQGEQVRYAAALAVVGRFLSRIDPTHADRFFDLSAALSDYSSGSRPPILKRLKKKSAPNPTQVEAAKATVAFALDALIALGQKPEVAARSLLTHYPDIKHLAGPKSLGPTGFLPKTILEWRKTFSSPSRSKNDFAAEIFAVGRDLIDSRVKTEHGKEELKRIADSRAKYAAQVGVFVAASNTP
jgi:hypothetical protein